MPQARGWARAALVRASTRAANVPPGVGAGGVGAGPGAGAGAPGPQAARSRGSRSREARATRFILALFIGVFL
ncbi:hypothetical protein GCM10017782_22630 [Deinococcus ficus]|nr:hypothetical protein GCM10017782_22630 [Deinococcus ficus]